MRICSLLFFLVLTLLPVASLAATYTAASCALSDVQAAYNAASPGDTVVVPAGECTWSSGLTIGKPLSIIGAGSGEGGTKLIASGKMLTGFFYVTGFTSSSLMRISGFYFEMNNWTPQYGIRVQNNVSLTSLRIDHNVFSQGGDSQILATGSTGVIDNNYFYNGNVGVYFSAGSAEQATASWISMAAGTSDALFIEDNHFIDDAGYSQSYSQERIGTFNGGKLVVRYNHFDFYEFPLASNALPIMTHGSAAGGVANGYWQIGTGGRRGQSVVEVYNNVMEGKRIDFLAVLRGSANLIYNNKVVRSGGYASRIQLQEEEYGGSGTQWNPLRTGWPAEDQVHNTFLWNNTDNGSSMDASDRIAKYPGNDNCVGNLDPFTCCTGSKSGSCNDLIKENRDYFLHAPEATGGKETFTGLNGASGSYPTDGVRHPTLGTMVFEPEGPNAYYPYTPFTYPHPLRADTAATAPGSPSNLRVQ